jgi:hypothetical protein
MSSTRFCADREHTPTIRAAQPSGEDRPAFPRFFRTIRHDGHPPAKTLVTLRMSKPPVRFCRHRGTTPLEPSRPLTAMPATSLARARETSALVPSRRGAY